MKYRNPPVVEVSITIDFDPNPNKQKWDFDLVREFMLSQSKEFPKFQAAHSREIKVEETSPTDLPTVVGVENKLQGIRLWDATQSRMLFLGDDTMSYHIMKSVDSPPSYRRVRDALQPKLEAYVELFQPSLVRQTALRYLDIIEIPKPSGGKMELKDYFAFSVDLPERPFGLISGLTCHFQVNCPIDNGPLLVQFEIMPAPADEEVIRFRMGWIKQSAEINTLDFGQIWSKMELDHEYIRQCFAAAFQPRTLELFDPIDEDH